MSDKIVEAVARALAESNGDDPDEQVQMFFTKGEGPLWENYSGMARAAIEAYEAEKRISVSTAYYFNGIPVSDLNREQQEEYLAYMKKLGARL